jgi:DNA-binding LytR/AlgR family response regulator
MTPASRPRALVADDEPLLRSELVRLLGETWPTLEVVAEARNGREAIARFEATRPEVCFLDVHMPGLSGLDAARRIGDRAHLVFVTAHDQYAVEAFARGVLDYLVKPVTRERLADTVARLQSRLRSAQPALDSAALLDQLARMMIEPRATATPLRWLRASVGASLRLIAVDDVEFLRSDDKYTRIGWRDDGNRAADALVRTPLKELVAQLDPTCFVQVHRSVVVNLRAIAEVVRDDHDSARIRLRGRDEELPVSRSYLHHFRQM